jgi:hypothetical protein
MISPFSLLVSRTNEDFNIELEKDHNDGPNLAPIYKIFCSCFILGEAGVIRQQYFDEKFNDYFDIYSYNFYHNEENVGFSHFVPLEKATEIYNGNMLADMHYDMKLLPFASGDGNGIFVCLDFENLDKIFWDRGDGEPVAIANNAFEFVKNIQVKTVAEEFLYNGVKHAQLYKKFGENFWRHK